MAPHPDEPDTLSRLEKCVRQGDWNAVSRLAGQISGEATAGSRDALTERILRLRKALIVARTARAGLSDSLARVRAAARFSYSSDSDSRQGFAIPTKY